MYAVTMIKMQCIAHNPCNYHEPHEECVSVLWICAYFSVYTTLKSRFSLFVIIWDEFENGASGYCSYVCKCFFFCFIFMLTKLGFGWKLAAIFSVQLVIVLTFVTMGCVVLMLVGSDMWFANGICKLGYGSWILCQNNIDQLTGIENIRYKVKCVI